MRIPPPPTTRRVLIDTSAYFAVADPRDTNAPRAVAVAERLSLLRFRQFTTNFILAETHALLLARAGRHLARRLLRGIDESAAVIVRVSAGDERRAREILHQYDDKDFSLTDATTFAAMERLGIPYAFSFDRHFTQYGFMLASPEMGLGDRK